MSRMAINTARSGNGGGGGGGGHTVAQDNMRKTLHGLQRELHSLKEENRELKYQLVLIHSEPTGSLDVQQQEQVRVLQDEVSRLRDELQQTREKHEASEVHRTQVEQENTFLKTKFRQLQDQAAQLKRMWEQQNAEISHLRQRRVHQNTLSSSHLDTLDRMGGTSLRPGRRRPRRTSSSSSAGHKSLSAPLVRSSHPPPARQAMPATLPPIETSLRISPSKQHSRSVFEDNLQPSPSP